MSQSTIRTTITLPQELLKTIDSMVNQKKVKSRNEFIAQALRNEIKALQSREIDAKLAEMAQDPDYQAEVLKMEAEFTTAS
jgi:metal-responsive CopG/Arc/MetJ family transcriptional regulator